MRCLFFFLIDFIVAVLMGRFSLISQLFLLGFGFFNFLVGWFWVFLGWWAGGTLRNFRSRKYHETVYVPYIVVAFRGVFQSLCWEIGKISKASWQILFFFHSKFILHAE